MKVLSIFTIKGRILVSLIGLPETPIKIGDILFSGPSHYRITDIAHIRYAFLGLPLEKRPFGLILVQCEGTETWPIEGDELMVQENNELRSH